MSEHLSQLSQEFVNTFPRQTNIRSYDFSAARLLVNSVTAPLQTSRRELAKTFSDMYPRSNSRYDVSIAYTTDMSIDANVESINVTGYVNDTLVSTTLNIYREPNKFREDYDFIPPNYLVTEATGLATIGIPSGDLTNPSIIDPVSGFIGYNAIYPSGFGIDYNSDFGVFTICPTSYAHELSIKHSFDMYKKSDVCFVVYGVRFNEFLEYGAYQTIRVYGYSKSDPTTVKVENIRVGYDGAYYSMVDWLYIDKVVFSNMNRDFIRILSPSTNVGYRKIPYRWVKKDKVFMSDGLLTWVSGAPNNGFFKLFEYKVNEAGEVIDDPDYVFAIADEWGMQLTSINDFDFDPVSKDLIVLTDDYTVNMYSNEKSIPDRVKTLSTVRMCPYNLEFEVYDDTTIMVKVYNKFVGNPFDYLFAITATTPAGGTYLLDGTGNSSSDTGEYFAFDNYPVRFPFTLSEFGPYVFTIRYFDTELGMYKFHEMLYNHDIKRPIVSFQLDTPYRGISCPYRGTLNLLRYDSTYDICLYKSPQVLYTQESGTLAFTDILPQIVEVNGVTTSFDNSWFTNTDRNFMFGHLSLLGT